MENEKADGQLIMALYTPEEEREKSRELDVGYSRETKTWELIVKYNGDISFLEEGGIEVVELLGGYAVLSGVREEEIDELIALPQIEYVEQPKSLYFAVEEGSSVSCVTPVRQEPLALTGRGTLVGIVDSGIDYTHPDFRNEDGTTRVAALWDQTVSGRPPEGYIRGALFPEEQINEALSSPDPYAVVPSRDLSGHGTHVAGIAAGNGRASESGRSRGIAYEAQLVVIKLGTPDREGFPRTTQLMEAVDYAIRFALEKGMPIALNISFGNNFGSHNSNSLLERYLDNVSGVWKNVIVIGTGNEGNTGKHRGGIIMPEEEETAEMTVGAYEINLSVQIWKNYYDSFRIICTSPGGDSYTFSSDPGIYKIRLGGTVLQILVGEPTPYSILQEIFVDFFGEPYIQSGGWRWTFVAERIVRGNYDIWLPVGGNSPDTRFLIPTLETSLTIPSTASLPIGVGAYDPATRQIAPFSGRGFTRDGQYIKPSLVAPGVNIVSAAPGGGYTAKSGTSMATPFVTGGAALLMEWGIVQDHDSFLYGEKVKAYLLRGARRLPGYREYPNPQTGYGALCIRDSLPV